LAPSPESTVSIRTLLVVTLICVPGVIAGCRGDTADPPTNPASTTAIIATTPATGAALDPILVNLCGVLKASEAGELEVVRTTFDHGPLHTLANEVIDINRTVAAHLLVAKEAVEADLADAAAPPSDLTADLDALVRATAEALTITGSPTPPSCPGNTL
jgi:hypothetical protein